MKLITGIISFCLLFVLSSCGGKSKTPLVLKNSGIVGGRVASNSQFPWQVSIQSKNGNHYCGGSVISKRAVITAAHCMEHEKPEDVKVAGGGSNGHLSTQTPFPKVKEVIVHEGWTGGYTEIVNHDIALITFESDIPLSQNLKIVALPKRINVSESFSYLGSKLVSSGWGDTKNPNENSNQLRYYEVYPLASALDMEFWNEDAQYYYIFADLGRRMLRGNFLVSNTPNASTCGGDSGGPLVALPGNEFTKPTLIGLTSAGGDTACSNVVFHTNVQLYLDWINAQGIPI